MLLVIFKNEVIMNKKERFNEAFRFLRGKGFVQTQKDVAEKMGSTAPNVSSALKGVESVLTENFLRRFNSAFDGVFSDDWLISGEGEMLSPSISQTVTGDGNTSVAGIGNHVTQSSEVSRFLSLLEKKDVQFDCLLSELAAQRRQIDHLLGLKSDSNA